MEIKVNVDDTLWDKFTKQKKKTDIDQITEEAIKAYLERLRLYDRLLKLEGQVNWEGNLDQLRENRF